MNPQDALLQQLQDIETPAAIGWWPLAPGWWILFVLALVTLTIISFKIYRVWQAKRYRREALKQLQRLSTHSGKSQAEALIALLKRCAFSAYPEQRNAIAGLYGETFFSFLVNCLPANSIKHLQPQEPWFTCLYQKSEVDETTLAVLKKFTQQWIKNHETRKHYPVQNNLRGIQNG